MGAVNRQFRRQEQRQKMREWVRDGTVERVRKLSVNGITIDEVKEAKREGYEEGYKYASVAFMRGMYAAIAKELFEAGNPKEEVCYFIHNVDRRFAVILDAEEELQEVFDLMGIRIRLEPDGISSIEVVKSE